MSVTGPNRPPIQGGINAAGAAAEAAKTAGTAIAKGASEVGKAVAGTAKTIGDTFAAAKPGAFEIKDFSHGIMAGGCCFPPPTGPLKPAGGGLGGIAGGIGSAVEGAVLRMNRDAAKDKFDKSVDDSMKPGSQGGPRSPMASSARSTRPAATTRSRTRRSTSTTPRKRRRRPSTRPRRRVRSPTSIRRRSTTPRTRSTSFRANSTRWWPRTRWRT